MGSSPLGAASVASDWSLDLGDVGSYCLQEWGLRKVE